MTVESIITKSSNHQIIKLFLLFCFFIPVTAFCQKKGSDSVINEKGKKYYLHTVKKGETIYGISEKFNVKTSDIVLENPSAIDGIKQGDELKIPMQVVSKSTALIPPPNYVYHKVESKETLYSLAKKYHTTVSILDSLNPDLQANGLKKGSVIRIPLANADNTNAQSPATPPKNKNEAQAYKSLINSGIKTNNDTNLLSAHTSPPVILNDSAIKLSRYNVALIMPFASEATDSMHLERLTNESEQIPFATQFSTSFYNGLKLAFDSISKQGFRVNLHVYNITASSDTFSMSLDSLLKSPVMAKMNLIIGPPYPANFKRVARFAASHHIPVVSPLSPDTSVLSANPYSSKTTPSTITEMEASADFIAKNYFHATIVVVHNSAISDEKYYEAFKKKLKSDMLADSNKDSVYVAEYSGGLTNIENKLSTKTMNIVIFPYLGTSLVARFINQFANSSYGKRDSIVLFGMHKWTNNDALDITNLDTLQFHFPSNEFINYNNLNVKIFLIKYRNTYFTEPDYYACQGFDIGMFYGTLLNQFGTGLQDHLGDIKYKGVQTSFNMVRPKPTDGYENNMVYILQYIDYSEVMDARGLH